MLSTQLNGGSIAKYRPIGHDGEPIYKNAEAFIAALKLYPSIGEAKTNCLAVPRISSDGLNIDWYVPFQPKNPSGEYQVVAWQSATHQEQQEALAILSDLEQSLRKLGSELQRRGAEGQSQLMASYLTGKRSSQNLPAIHFPGPEYVYIVDGIPVITFWGFESGRDDLSRSPLDVLRYPHSSYVLANKNAFNSNETNGSLVGGAGLAAGAADAAFGPGSGNTMGATSTTGDSQQEENKGDSHKLCAWFTNHNCPLAGFFALLPLWLSWLLGILLFLLVLLLLWWLWPFLWGWLSSLLGLGGSGFVPSKDGFNSSNNVVQERVVDTSNSSNTSIVYDNNRGGTAVNANDSYTSRKNVNIDIDNGGDRGVGVNRSSNTYESINMRINNSDIQPADITRATNIYKSFNMHVTNGRVPADAITSANVNFASMDLDGDGKVDYVDINNDNLAEGVWIDINNDGKEDLVGFDFDNDSLFDGVGLDVNNDSSLDSIGIDINNDGIIDGIDTNGDGVIDFSIMDNKTSTSDVASILHGDQAVVDTAVQDVLSEAISKTSLVFAPMDLNGDGKIDSVDINNDHRADGLALDSNNDGIVDMATFDFNKDGKFEGVGVDLNGDGQLDNIGIDSNQDGIIDGIDTNGDGIIDIPLPDNVALPSYGDATGVVVGDGTGTGVVVGDGTGTGVVTGDGTGSGIGVGDSSGIGVGTGTGDGTGSGASAGMGSGMGTGDGSGTGMGTGSGSGDGSGSGQGQGNPTVVPPELDPDALKRANQAGAQDGSGNQTGSGNQAGSGNQTGSGNQAGPGNQTGSGNQAGPGNQTGSGNQAGSGNQTGSGNQAGPGNQAGSGNQAGQGQPTGATKNLSFTREDVQQEGAKVVDGQWSTRSALMDSSNGRPLQLSYNMQGGKGQVQITRYDGTKCVAPVSAVSSKGGVTLNASGRAICPDKSSYQIPDIECGVDDLGGVRCNGNSQNTSFPIQLYSAQ